MPNSFYLIEMLCAVIFYSTIIRVQSYRALLWALSFSAVVAAISSIAGGMQGDSLSGAFVMAFGIVFVFPLVLGGLVGSFVAWLILKMRASTTSNSGRIFLVIMGMFVTVLVSAHGFYGQLYAGKTTCSDETRVLVPEKPAHIKIGNLDLTVPPDQRDGILWLIDKSSFLFGEVETPKVLHLGEFDIYACDLTKGFNRPIDADTIKFSTTFTPQYEIHDDKLGDDMEYEEWSEAYGIEFMSTDLDISTWSYIARDMLELEGTGFWGYLDLSRICAAPLTAYYALKENDYGNETHSRI